MGRSIAVTYTVHLYVAGQFYTPSEWRVRSRNNGPSYGKPTAANLANYVKTFEESTHGEGCNKHLGVQKVLRAEIIHQPTRTLVATYAATS
jgi:hypothetical protein